MKGTLMKTEQGWMVEHEVAEKTPIGYKSWWGTFPLHPTDVKTCIDYGDYSVDWGGKEVQFDFVTEWENGEVGVNGLTYAKLIHHPVDTNEMINHIGEVNEMVNHVPDVGKMVSNVEISKKRWDDWDEFNKKACYPEDHQSAFADGFTRGAKWVNEIAKETLYTEEQVREAIDMARSQSGYASYEYNENEIIQSLKK